MLRAASLLISLLQDQHRSGPGLIPASSSRLGSVTHSGVRMRLRPFARPSVLPLRCWPPSFRGVMSFVAQRPITESNRPPSYQASTGEPESNRHFLCWRPEVIPAFWSLRPKPFTSTVKALRITTAHSPTRKRAIHAACLWVRPGFGVAAHAPVQFCTPALFLVGPGLRFPGAGPI